MAADPADPEHTPTEVDDVVDADVPADVETDAPEAAASTDPEAGAADAKEVDAPGKTDGSGAEPAKPAVVRKKVVSKRVTPKGGPQAAKAAGGSTGPRTKASPKVDIDEGYSKRYTPPAQTYARGPSPWWVPAIMFGFLIIGALVIMLNYSGVFGDPENIRLIIGLGFILGGIITATQYR